MGILKATTMGVSIACSPKRAYAFISDPSTLPQWATSFCRSVKNVGGEWMVDTPDGQMSIRFVPANEFGVLDHYVTAAQGGPIILNPMRVVPNGSGCELMFTLFQAEGMSDERLATDLAMVRKDLNTLKRVLETVEVGAPNGVA